MRKGQSGFTFIEIAMATAMTALIASTATMTTFSVLNNTERTNNRMAVIGQVENTGYWISRDIQMASNISTDNLTPPDFLVLTWTEWGYDEDSVYHSVTYSIEAISGGIGKLKRNHQDSQGSDEQALIAQYVYYNLSDPANTSNVSYQEPMLTLKIACQLEDAQEMREYKIQRRPNFQ